MAKAGDLDWSDLIKNDFPYTISHEMSPKGVLMVTARDSANNIVGTAHFSHSGTTDRYMAANRKEFGIKGLMPENAQVHQDHRRRGIATKMYEYASNVMKMPIVKPPEEHQTADAMAMWQSRLKKTWPEWSNEELQKVFGNKRLQLQATDEQLFGHLVTDQEQLDKAERDFNNKFNDWYSAANRPVDNKQIDWGDGKSFNSTLTEEERLKRNMHLGDEGDF